MYSCKMISVKNKKKYFVEDYLGRNLTEIINLYYMDRKVLNLEKVSSGGHLIYIVKEIIIKFLKIKGFTLKRTYGLQITMFS